MLAGVANIGSIDILVTKAIAFRDGLNQTIAFRYKYVMFKLKVIPRSSHLLYQ